MRGALCAQTTRSNRHPAPRCPCRFDGNKNVVQELILIGHRFVFVHNCIYSAYAYSYWVWMFVMMMTAIISVARTKSINYLSITYVCIYIYVLERGGYLHITYKLIICSRNVEWNIRMGDFTISYIFRRFNHWPTVVIPRNRFGCFIFVWHISLHNRW